MQKQNDTTRWISVAVTLIVLAAGIVASFATVQADAKNRDQRIVEIEDRKADKALMETRLLHIEQTLQEIKTENKEAHTRLESKIDGK